MEILRFAFRGSGQAQNDRGGRKNWWRWRASNPRPAAYESAALPPELHRHGEESFVTLYHNARSFDNVAAFTP